MLLVTVTAAALAGDLGYGERWIAVPAAFYSQETSVGAVVFGSVTFPSAREDTWPSTLAAAVVGTVQGQATVTLWPTVFLGPRNQWSLTGRVVGAHFPTRYYGLGPDTTGEYQPFTRRWVTSELSLLRRVAGPLYIGAVDQVSVFDVRDIGAPTGPLDEPLGTGAIPGEAGGVVHGLGARARLEGRDNPQSARDGIYADVRWVAFGPALGSSYGYTEAAVDLRGYHTILGDLTLTSQAIVEGRTGEPPFTHEAELGGDNVLRGLFRGRYRDRSLAALQAEVRVPLFWRFRGVAFGGVGEVFSDPETLLDGPPRWTAGGGLRYELDRENHTTVRLDVGAGPDGVGVIFNFGEAW